MSAKEDISRYLSENLGLDDECIADLYGSYLGMLDEYIGKLDAALGAANCAELRRIGHTIKGSSANVGHEPMRFAGLKLQEAGDAADMDAVRNAVTLILNERKTLD